MFALHYFLLLTRSFSVWTMCVSRNWKYIHYYKPTFHTHPHIKELCYYLKANKNFSGALLSTYWWEKKNHIKVCFLFKTFVISKQIYQHVYYVTDVFYFLTIVLVLALLMELLYGIIIYFYIFIKLVVQEITERKVS